MAANTASQPQIKFITDLLASRDLSAEAVARITARMEADNFTKKEASASIDFLKAKPFKKVAVVTTEVVTTPAKIAVQDPRLSVGVYVMPDGTIVQLVATKDKTRLYPKIWTSFSGTRLTLAGTKVKAHWEYDAKMVKPIMLALTADMRMTKAQALEFATIFSQCAKCARKIEDAKSIEAGIGPVCRKYFPGF